MTANPSSRHSTTTLLDVEPAPPQFVTCPLCHTTRPTVAGDTLEAGIDWRCARCGQTWDALRLATVAAYAAWAVEHDAYGAPPLNSGSQTKVNPSNRSEIREPISTWENEGGPP